MLEIAQKKTKNVVGVDPAKNLMSKIKKNYLELIPDFFNKKNGEYLKSKYKQFDVIVALNVIPHTINVKEILGQVGKLLSDDGIFLWKELIFLIRFTKVNSIRYIMSMYQVLLCIVLKIS